MHVLQHANLFGKGVLCPSRDFCDLSLVEVQISRRAPTMLPARSFSERVEIFRHQVFWLDGGKIPACIGGLSWLSWILLLLLLLLL